MTIALTREARILRRADRADRAADSRSAQRLRALAAEADSIRDAGPAVRRA